MAADMNLDALDGRWLEPGYNLLSLSRMVQNTCNGYNFTQLVKEATRVQFNSIQSSTSISCIDHIYTNAKFRCSNVTITPFGNSDHDILSYTRFSKEPREPARTIRKRSYKKFNEEKYLQDLAKFDWSDVLTSGDVDQAAELLTRKIRYCLNVHAPWVVFQQRKFFSPWLSEVTKQMMVERDRLKQEAKDLAIRDTERGFTSDEQVAAWVKYKKIRNKINNNKRKDENCYKNLKINEDLTCPAKAWNQAKIFMGWKSNGTPCQLVDNNGILVTKAGKIANTMNDFFVNKVENIRKGLKKLPEKLEECFRIMQGKKCKIALNFVNVNIVTKHLKNLKSSKCTSIDELDSYAVKLSAEIIAHPLHHVFTLSMMQNKFPTCWKYTKLIPLHKKLSKLEMKNYRPIAILSPLSKVLEKIVYLQVYEYFTANKLFHPNLHGYRQNRSTLTALLQMYDRWVRAASASQVSGVVLIDLSAAFDLVDSNILLNKLKIYGFDSCFLQWIKSYLTQRYQAVWIDHIYLDYKAHSIGVPQGSNLGPLFFLIYFSDLLFTLDCDIDAYADDSTLSSTGKTLAEISTSLTDNCRRVVNWMESNQFKLNANKTHLITVGTGERLGGLQEKLQVEMDSVLLKEGDSKIEFLLGCEIQANLKWAEQVEKLLVKLKSRVAGLTSLKHALPFHTRNTFTIGIFNSILVYCLPLFGGCNTSHIKSIQVLQNRAARVVTHLPPRSNREFMYNKLKWLTVNQLVVYHTLLTVFKIRLSGEPEYLAKYLRHDNRLGKIIIPNTTLSLARRSFTWRGSENWNSLPVDLRECRKISHFKPRLRNWVTRNISRFLE